MADQKLTAKLGLDTSEFDRNLDRSDDKMQGFGKGMSSVAGKISIAFAAVASAFTVLKKGIEQTEGSSDNFKFAVASLDGAWQGFWRTVWQGDWGALFQNISNTAEATRDLKEAMDGLEMSFASNTIKKARLRGEISGAVLGAAETSDPAKRKEYYNQAIEAQKALTAVEVSEVARKLQVNEDFYKKLKGYDKNYSDFMITKIREIAGNWDYFFGDNSVAMEGIKANIEHLKFMKDAQFRPADIAKYDKQIKEQELILNVLEDMKSLEAGLKPDQFRDYVTLIGEYFEAIAKGDQDLTMLNRRLTQANSKMQSMTGGTRSTGSTDIPYADIKHLSPSQGLMPYANDIVEADISEVTDALNKQQYAVDVLSDAFTQLFSNTEDGFQGMIDTMIAGIERLVAEMLANKIVELVMDYFGGGSINFLKNIGGETASSIGGTPSGVTGGSSMDYLNVNVQGEMSGKDLKWVAKRW